MTRKTANPYYVNMKKQRTGPVKGLATALFVTLIFAAVMDYVTLPAYNIHSIETLFLFAFYFGFFAFLSIFFTGRFTKFALGALGAAGLIVAFVAVMSLLGSEILNARSFRNQIKITESGDFSNDFDLIQYNEVPLVDYETARQLGDKQMGKIQGLGSQYNINIDYTLISVDNGVYRVAPLEYQDIFKWLENKSEGIPGYVKVNVRDVNDVSLVTLTEGIKYSPSAFFDQDLLRHVRFAYRTDILNDFSFEIDDAGHPYYVISIIEAEVGFFSGWDAQGVIVVDAVSGEMNKYGLDDIPSWVDRVQPVDLAWYQVDNWGYYVNGWFNTIFGRKDVIQTTDGFNYVSINGQTHVFSGMTSVGADQSIVGFSLINLKTKEASFYRVGGADESSAMSSAQGAVQHLGYISTFPVLLNVEGEPSYFMSLKDQEGLVKMFALVSVTDYSVVGVGTTLNETRANYIKKLIEAGILESAVELEKTITAQVTKIASAIVDGDTQFYMTVQGDAHLFVVPLGLSPETVLTQVGDLITITYYESSAKTIVAIEFDNTLYDY
ncbi:MAG: hypothetical protein FD133_1174 [Erysipelotrichaceae bacterium]|nr:MAG: hypothetical protein FD179_1599 [Erysipelotrichaceae bacterium]TXT17890.1 MAG: hypothetical protein FD133_1174 [Erysipelotrichaceae bacterium]